MSEKWKYVTDRQAIGDSITRHVRYACCITKPTDRHSRVRNTYCLSTTRMVTRTRLNTTFISTLSLLLRLVNSLEFWSRTSYTGADKSLSRPGRKQANIYVRMAWIFFGALPCRKIRTWWQIASRCCWNRARPWHVSELVSFLVGLRTYQHPGTYCLSTTRMVTRTRLNTRFISTLPHLLHLVSGVASRVASHHASFPRHRHFEITYYSDVLLEVVPVSVTQT